MLLPAKRPRIESACLCCIGPLLLSPFDFSPECEEAAETRGLAVSVIVDIGMMMMFSNERILLRLNTIRTTPCNISVLDQPGGPHSVVYYDLALGTIRGEIP